MSRRDFWECPFMFPFCYIIQWHSYFLKCGVSDQMYFEATVWTWVSFYLRSILFCVRVSTNTQIATACVLKCLLVLAWVLKYTRLESELSSIQAFWMVAYRRGLIGCRGLHQQWYHGWRVGHYVTSETFNDERCHLWSFRFEVLSKVQ